MTDPRIEAAANVIADRDYPYYEPDIAFATEVITAIDNASTITTVEELDALPAGSVILDGDPAILQMVEKSNVVGSEWAMANEEHIYTTGKITLPARVLYWGN